MNNPVEAHYTRGNLLDAIREAFLRAGKNPESLTPQDLAPVDEFHIRGRQATEELASLLEVGSGSRVLDVGSGIGGPARFLAATRGCHVTGVDLTAEFCQAATELARWVGLSELVEYRQANALSLPFPDQTFDAAWTQHVAMNIADKARLYAEVQRVLKPGARFVCYDVLQGPGGDVVYPTPWASHSSLSHLVAPDEMRRLLPQAGLEIFHWRETSEAGLHWFREGMRRWTEQGPPAAIRIALGPNFAQMAQNMVRNLEEHRLVIFEFACRRA